MASQIGGLVPFEKARKAGKLPAFEKKRTKANRDIAKRFREVLGPDPVKAKPRRTAFESEPTIYEDRDDEENED